MIWQAFANRSLQRWCLQFCWLGLLPAQAQMLPSAAQEAELQAVFVVNFLRLTQWPSMPSTTPSAPLVLCVDMNHELLLSALRRSDIGMIQDRTLLLRRLLRGESLKECHALVIDAQTARQTSTGQLSIGDTPEFAEAGGIITFVRLDNRLRFQINLDSAKRAQLQLSSKLLKLAVPSWSTNKPP